jgi:hypothetical protein
MRLLPAVLGILGGLAGAIFGYFMLVLTYLGASADAPARGACGTLFLALLIAAPLVSVAGGVADYFRPSLGQMLLGLSAAGWVGAVLLDVYLRWLDPSKLPLKAMDALGLIAVLSIPGLVTVLGLALSRFTRMRETRTLG